MERAKKTYKITFQYSETTYCTNLAIADSITAVEKHYIKYPSILSITEATESDKNEATRKGMPIINIESETAPETQETTTES